MKLRGDLLIEMFMQTFADMDVSHSSLVNFHGSQWYI